MADIHKNNRTKLPFSVYLFIHGISIHNKLCTYTYLHNTCCQLRAISISIHLAIVNKVDISIKDQALCHRSSYEIQISNFN